MKNKFFASLVIVLLCRDFTLGAGGARSKHKKQQENFVLVAIAAGHNDHFNRAFACPFIDVNAQYKENGCTSLMVAVSAHTSFIWPLIERGACIHQTNKDGHTAITLLLDRDDHTWGKKMALRCLLNNNKCKHPIKNKNAETSPEGILARLRARDCDVARAKAAFLAETIEELEDEKRRTVAETVLAADKIFPASVDDIILSYVSNSEEQPWQPHELELRFRSQHECVPTRWLWLRRRQD